MVLLGSKRADGGAQIRKIIDQTEAVDLQATGTAVLGLQEDRRRKFAGDRRASPPVRKTRSHGAPMMPQPINQRRTSVATCITTNDPAAGSTTRSPGFVTAPISRAPPAAAARVMSLDQAHTGCD